MKLHKKPAGARASSLLVYPDFSESGSCWLAISFSAKKSMWSRPYLVPHSFLQINQLNPLIFTQVSAVLFVYRVVPVLMNT